MTYARRAEILSKELITIGELAELLDVPYSTAAKVMRDIKRSSDRLKIQGRLHVQDYLDYCFIPKGNPRYTYDTFDTEK